jgi:Kdo2-lipid IVA lauroyltransferase/acyltransferase
MNSSINPVLKKIKNDLIYVFVYCITMVWRIIPRKLGLSLFGMCGSLLYRLPLKENSWTRQHLGLIFGARFSEKEINRLAARVYAGLGKNLFDALYLSRASKQKIDEIVKCDDLTPLWNAYNMKKGVLTVVAHTGCFEMLLHYFASLGFGCFAIGRELYDHRIDDLVRKHRTGENIVYLHRTENLRKFLKLIGEGRLFGVLIDQDTKVDGVFAHFLGRLAFTPSGAVKLAMRLGLPVFVVTTARQKGDAHRIFVREIKLDSGNDVDTDLVHNVEKINSAISETIEAYPDQWVWMHRRWRHTPADKGYENAPTIEMATNKRVTN